MIQVYPASSRYSADHGWLQSRFGFSFAEYRDPANMNFGPLRVFNDDIVQPENGFGMHPHREMEIVSVVLKGQIRHEDSMGNKEILLPGEIQRMTAGTGITHSEVNPSKDEELHLLQLWFLPDQNRLEPSYEQFAYNEAAMRNALLPVVSNEPNPDHRVAHIHQDLTLYLSRLEAGERLAFAQSESRKTYIFVIEGSLTVNNQVLGARDAARITEESMLELQAAANNYFMLIDLP
ncbi:MAG: pirin [Paenibacillus sp.]|jgi:redox-sensitive bicupin YhaK (pirin superfamily)|nr:pirin [Paenibacillus sp.]